MDAVQSPKEFSEPPLVRVDGELFVLGVSWNLNRFSSRDGSGGRRRYVLARIDPDTLTAAESSSGDAPFIAFGPSAVGLVGAGDQLFIIAGGELSLAIRGLQLQRISTDLENTAGQIAVVSAGDLFAITGVIVQHEMRYSKLWVWNNHTHSLVFSHQFGLTERAVALAVDEINQAVLLDTQDGIREMSYIDGSDRKTLIGQASGNSWAFPCGRYLIIPRLARYSDNTGYSVFDPTSRKARYWSASGVTYSGGACGDDVLYAVAYKSKGNTRAKSLEDSGCIDCQLAYDPRRLPTKQPESATQPEKTKVTSEQIAAYSLTSGKSVQIAANLPSEIPLASTWDSERKKLFVMTTSHICSVAVQ